MERRDQLPQNHPSVLVPWSDWDQNCCHTLETILLLLFPTPEKLQHCNYSKINNYLSTIKASKAWLYDIPIIYCISTTSPFSSTQNPSIADVLQRVAPRWWTRWEWIWSFQNWTWCLSHSVWCHSVWCHSHVMSVERSQLKRGPPLRFCSRLPAAHVSWIWRFAGRGSAQMSLCLRNMKITSFTRAERLREAEDRGRRLREHAENEHQTPGTSSTFHRRSCGLWLKPSQTSLGHTGGLRPDLFLSRR